MTNFSEEAFKLLNLSTAQGNKILEDYSAANGFTPQDWAAATDGLQDRQVPKVNQFEAYLLQARRKRQGEVKVKQSDSRDPAVFATRFLWNGQQVYETTQDPLGAWTICKADGTVEQYLSDRLPPMAEQQESKILTGPRAGWTLMGSDAVYRAGVYVSQGDEEVFEELPRGWRKRPECTALPQAPRKVQGFTRLGDVKGMKHGK